MTKLTPPETARIVAMREAGYTHLSISHLTGRSLASIKRVCRSHKAEAGTVAEEIFSAARAQLKAKIAGDDQIRVLAAATLHDTQLLTELIREKLAESTARLTATSIEDAHRTIKTLNSAANAVKLTTDAIRAARKLDTTSSVDETTLPSLVIESLSEEEVAALRADQQREEAELYGYDHIATSEAPEYH